MLQVPADRVEKYWPLIDRALSTVCWPDYNDNVRVAALSTVRVECPPFCPIHEYGSDALHEKLYGHRKDLGNANDGDGAKYAGRGFIQLTGELNYAAYSKIIGHDLVHDPDDALEPAQSAAIFAAYFHSRGCAKAAVGRQWEKVRHLVNGGSNGMPAFLYYITQLEIADRGKATAAGAPQA